MAEKKKTGTGTSAAGKKPAAARPRQGKSARKAKNVADAPLVGGLPVAPTLVDYVGATCWLMKSEPEVFSIQDLQARPGQKEKWDGVRNFQARNFMRDWMRPGHKALFYHSSCTPAGIAGMMEIVSGFAPDLSALDAKSSGYDPKATKANPVWGCVTVGKPKPFARVLSLEEIRAEPALKKMLLLRPGQRLSILPLSESEFSCILRLADAILPRR